jgi:hypothetical protein
MSLSPDATWKEADLIGGQDTNANAGFILAEESALREYLSGITVPNFTGGKQQKETRTVPVYYRWPTSERNIVYPYITIDLLSIDPAYERWQSWTDSFQIPAQFVRDDQPGHVRYGNYYPDQAHDVELSNEDSFGFKSGPYMPYNMLFQVSVFSRTVHDDRYLASRFFVDFFAQRNFWVATEIDKVWHRCELQSFVSGDSMETMEATKRQFRKIFTVRMETEIPSEKLWELRKVRKVNIKYFDEEDFLIDETNIPEESAP